jgi:hypothetical protein
MLNVIIIIIIIKIQKFKYRNSANVEHEMFRHTGNHSSHSVTDLPIYVFIPVVCWAPVDLGPREMVTPGSSNR